MPPVGRTFVQDVDAVLLSESIDAPDAPNPKGTVRPTTHDSMVWTWRSHSKTDYIHFCRVVDDFLVISSDGLLDRLVALLRTRWNVTIGDLDGFLNNQYHVSIVDDCRYITITMHVRLAEIMKEFLPDEMELDSYPPTPYHTDLKKLAIASEPFANAKAARRLNCLLMYCVVTVYLHGQYVVFFIAQFSSSPDQLYFDCCLHVLRHLYGTRHLGLTVGGRPIEMSVGATMPEFESGKGSFVRPKMRVGSEADSGHAEPGPSHGGYTMDLDGVTIHSVAGKHAATTIGTTGSEMYELSRCVAATIGYREFLVELGYPQTSPAPIGCDNSGAVLQAAAAAADKNQIYMRKRISFVQEAQLSEEVLVVKISGLVNKADVLTKVLSRTLYEKGRDVLINAARVCKQLHAHVRMIIAQLLH